MTEHERQRARGLRGMVNISRRQFIGGTVGFVGGLAVDQAVEKAVIEPLMPKSAPRSFASTTLAPERFEKIASDEQKAAMAFWQIGYSDFPKPVEERTTTTFSGSDGRRWMRSQGEDIRLGWGPLREMPMAEQPDGEYGAWRGTCLEQCAMKDEPIFELIHTQVMDKNGVARPHRYTALLLPFGGGEVSSTTAGV